MAVCAFVFVKYMKKHSINAGGTSNVEVITSLRLTARDIFLAVHCGPDVIAFTLGPNGACLMGRWSYEEWTKSQSDTGS